MYLRENVKALPGCFEFDKDKATAARCFSGERKLTKAEHIEIFEINPLLYEKEGVIKEEKTIVYFDYLNRKFDNNANTRHLEEQ